MGNVMTLLPASWRRAPHKVPATPVTSLECRAGRSNSPFLRPLIEVPGIRSRSKVPAPVKAQHLGVVTAPDLFSASGTPRSLTAPRG